jgi:hypothetical protein
MLRAGARLLTGACCSARSAGALHSAPGASCRLTARACTAGGQRERVPQMHAWRSLMSDLDLAWRAQ